ncbi:MAG TPA: hemerythrin domain-containing protein [Acidimicrobiales bacterium]|jgi:hemerythrin superfamily protein|nr:hemerythrin domain-containing protein [Acidimicrobiales bacterium]
MTETTDTMQGEGDVVDLLLAQHEQAKQLFSTVESGAGSRQEAFDQLLRLLAVHETAEEMVVYPALRRAPNGDAIAEARLAEEDKAKKVLADLESLGADGNGFMDRFEEFRTMVLDHAEAEEREVFPLIRANCNLDERLSMGQALMAAEAVAPTHPHKLAPESAVGNAVAGPVVALIDRVRDAIKNARQ